MEPSTSDVTFNPELFLNAEVEGALSTEYVLIPEGDHSGIIGPISADSFKSFDIKKGDNAGKKAYRLDLDIFVNDETGQLKEMLGRPPKIQYRLMLDMAAGGSLELGKGRNVNLGRLREAVHQNDGKKWSFGMLAGQPIRFKVKHNTYNERTNAEVTAVAAY